MRYYQYRPLDEGVREIRLVRLAPGKFDDDIIFGIEHAPFIPTKDETQIQISLEDVRNTLSDQWHVKETVEGRLIFCHRETKEQSWHHPNSHFQQHIKTLDDLVYPGKDAITSYEALSYTWGNDEATVPVKIIDGGAIGTTDDSAHRDHPLLYIRPNLHLALKHLRHHSQERMLWIDALCINQQDLKERAHEVRKMCEVYRRAHRVIVWLGPATNNSDMALELIDYIGHQIEYTKDNFFLRAPDAAEKDWHLRQGQMRLSDDDGTALKQLLSRSWFTRLWIWQEIRLANHRAIVQCGSKSVLWYHMRRAALVLSTKLSIPTTLSRDVAKRAGELSVYQYQFEEYDSVFWQTKAAEHSLRQDRIYGILGLLPRSIVNVVNVDYNLPEVNVYKDLCIAIMQTTGRLEFFDWCDIEDKSLLNRPSWVPNWSKPQITSRMYLLRYASGASGVDVKQENIDSLLEVVGTRCGIVRQVGTPAPSEGSVISCLRLWEPHSLHQAQYLERSSLLQSYVSLLCGGQTKDIAPTASWPTAEQCAKAYVSLTTQTLPADADGWVEAQFLLEVERKVRGRCFFQTNEYMGLCSPSARPGDLLVVLLGSDTPVLVRPNQDGTFALVCSSYVQDLMNAEGILGQLPKEWRWQVHAAQLGGTLPCFINNVTGPKTFDDPRLWTLPHDWDLQYIPESILTRYAPRYKLSRSDKGTWQDPRFAPEILKAHSIMLESFLLR